jgi:hypothetical protein
MCIFMCCIAPALIEVYTKGRKLFQRPCHLKIHVCSTAWRTVYEMSLCKAIFSQAIFLIGAH